MKKEEKIDILTMKPKPPRKGKMYEIPTYSKGLLRINQSKEGEPIEWKIERMIANKEPIKNGAPLIYTERKEGVRASTNIRTDRFEVAIDATNKISKSYKARREERAKPAEKKGENSGAESTQGKGETPTSK